MILIIFLFFLYSLYYLKFGIYINCKCLTHENRAYKLRNYNKWYACFNPSIFEYDSEIFYTYRVAVGGNMLNLRRLINVIINKFSYSRIIISNNCDIFSEVIIPQKYVNLYERGFEDPRAIVFKDNLLLIVSARNKIHKKNQIFIIIISLLNLQINKYEIHPKKIIEITPSLIEIQSQKNWMPFIHNSKLHLVYSINPYIVLQCNISDGTYKKIVETKYNFTNKLRGSSNIIKTSLKDYNDIYLGITHYRDGFIYTHRFYIFDTNFNILKIGKKFVIFGDKILLINRLTKYIFKYTKYLQLNTQFISGLHESKNRYHIMYGHDDSYAKELILENINNII